MKYLKKSHPTSPEQAAENYCLSRFVSFAPASDSWKRDVGSWRNGEKTNERKTYYENLHQKTNKDLKSLGNQLNKDIFGASAKYEKTFKSSPVISKQLASMFGEDPNNWKSLKAHRKSLAAMKWLANDQGINIDNPKNLAERKFVVENGVLSLDGTDGGEILSKEVKPYPYVDRDGETKENTYHANSKDGVIGEVIENKFVPFPRHENFRGIFVQEDDTFKKFLKFENNQVRDLTFEINEIENFRIRYNSEKFFAEAEKKIGVYKELTGEKEMPKKKATLRQGFEEFKVSYEIFKESVIDKLESYKKDVVPSVENISQLINDIADYQNARKNYEEAVDPIYEEVNKSLQTEIDTKIEEIFAENIDYEAREEGFAEIAKQVKSANDLLSPYASFEFPEKVKKLRERYDLDKSASQDQAIETLESQFSAENKLKKNWEVIAPQLAKSASVTVNGASIEAYAKNGKILGKHKFEGMRIRLLETVPVGNEFKISKLVLESSDFKPKDSEEEKKKDDNKGGLEGEGEKKEKLSAESLTKDIEELIATDLTGKKFEELKALKTKINELFTQSTGILDLRGEIIGKLKDFNKKVVAAMEVEKGKDGGGENKEGSEGEKKKSSLEDYRKFAKDMNELFKHGTDWFHLAGVVVDGVPKLQFQFKNLKSNDFKVFNAISVEEMASAEYEFLENTPGVKLTFENNTKFFAVKKEKNKYFYQTHTKNWTKIKLK